MRLAGLLICLAACGRYGFDARSGHGSGDASGDGTLGDDGAAAPDTASAGCWAAWRSGPLVFTTPQLVTELDTAAAEGDPSLTADALTMYFARANPTANDLFVTTRPTRQSPWAPASLVSELSTVEDETKLTLSADGLVAIWSVSRNGTLDYDLWQATRTSPTAAFSGVTQAPFAQVNDNQAQYDPHLSTDGLRLYLAPSKMASQSVQIASRTTTSGSFGAPVPVMGLGTTVNADPVLSPDELVIVYSAPQSTAAPVVLWYASRTSITAPFANPQPIPGINPGSQHHQDPMISFDGCELYFSNHAGASPDLYVSVIQ